MKHKTRTKALSWLLSLALMLSLIPVMSLPAYAANKPNITVVPKKSITYDGNKLDKSDFEFSGTDANLVNLDSTTITIEGCYKGNENGNLSENDYLIPGVTYKPISGAIGLGDNSNVDYTVTLQPDGSIKGSKNYTSSSLPEGKAYQAYKTEYKPVGNSTGIYITSFRLVDSASLEKYDLTSVGKHAAIIKINANSYDTLLLYVGNIQISTPFQITLAGGANATVSGAISQQVQRNAAMTTVTYTANSGYQFPKTSDLYKITNGITVTRTSDTVVTVSGTPTADTTITIPDARHVHSFTYTTDGDTITATCSDVANHTDNQNFIATLSIGAPANLAIDGTAKAAVITDENQIQGTATVSYYAADTNGDKNGEALTETPTAAGTYWAEITLTNGGSGANDSATAHVVYEITNPEYNITLPTGLAGGTVAAAIDETGVTKAHYNDTVTLTATANTHYHFKDNGFTVKDSNNGNVTVNNNQSTYTFTMPASAVTVTAEFEGDPFGITVNQSEHGGVTASGVGLTDNGAKAKAGSEVSLTVTPEAGYQVATLRYNDTDIAADDQGQYKFTMPTEAVTVSATFELKPVPISLSVTGSGGTAALLDDSYNEVESLTKKAGERFILLVDKDDEYDFNAKFGSDNASLTEFTKEEYEAYLAYAKNNNITLSSNMVLAWVTMPGVTEDRVTLTVEFSKLQTFTVLYQPSEENTTAAWCKFAVNSGVDGNNTASSQMKSDATMGDGSKVYSLKVTVGFAPTSVAFVTTNEKPSTPEALAALQTERLTALNNATMITGVTESQNTDSWINIDGGKYVVIGGDAKTVIVAFVSNAKNMAVYNSDTVAVDEGKGTDGVTYRVAVVTNGSAGTVTAPAAPANTDNSIRFAGWRGFQYDGNGKASEKIYAANEINIQVRDNATFNAVWEPVTLTVTLNPNGRTDVSDPDPVTYGEKLPTLENPTRSGFAFDGWTVSETVTENGTLFAKGSPFDLDTPITANLKLTAQWKHVHSYTCYQISSFPSLANYQKYNDAIHVAVCGCNDIQLMAHEFDSSGKCACGYQKPGAQDVTLNISYGQWSSETYTEKMKGMPETAKQGQEVSICAPDAWGNLQFSKWQYSTDNSTWYDLTADAYASFLIPATMYVRALYVNPVTVPQVDLSARQYDDHTVVNGKTYTMDNILFQMNYKLPDGYTFVDAGIRLGDNAGISYYELKEITYTANAEAKALVKGFAALGVLVSVDPTNARFAREADSSETRTFYEVHKNSVLDEMTAESLAKYMYESKPINVEKYDPIYWEAKAVTKGMSGSMATLPPLRFAQKDNQNHWIYGIGWLRYKDKDGNIQTIYTEALATTVNGVLQNSTGTVTKVGN